MSLLDSALAPVELALSSVLVAAHAAVAAVGLPPASGAAWASALALLVVAVRLALLPLVLRQVRSSRRLATASPALQEIRERYRGVRDRDALARMRAETAQVYREAGVGPVGALPLLLQAPVLLALFRVLEAAARGHVVGALGPALVAQLDGATLAGASLTQGLFAGGAATGVALVLIAIMAGTLWLAQRHQLTRNTPASALEGPAGRTRRLLAWIAPATALVAGFTFPLGLLVYAATANTVSLVQQLAVVRWLPTPGTPAAAAR